MRIGTIELDKPLALAPMEDVTDYSFRTICKEMGADLLYTEFASSEALIREVGKTLDKIRIRDEERPIAVQIFGSAESSMEGAAAVAEQAGIAKRTLERMEAGQTSQSGTLVRVLRVLDAASGLDNLIPESGPRPMDLLKQKGKVRQRASAKRAAKATGKPWRWDEKP